MEKFLGIGFGCEGNEKFSFESCEFEACAGPGHLPTDHFPRCSLLCCVSTGADLLVRIPRFPC